MLKFCANLNFLFTHETSSMIDRIKLAAKAGFKGVEIPFPYDLNPSDLASAKKCCDIEVVLMNSWPGDSAAGELGIAIDPTRCDQFREKLELSMTYLKALDCRRLHILAGMTALPEANNYSDRILEDTFVANLQYAAERLEHDGVMALVEAISHHAKPGYWLSDPVTAERIVRRVGHSNLRLQFDVFHAQLVGGNLTQRIKDWMPLMGHVQVAQVPNRDEPDSSGEVDFRYVFRHLSDTGYTGWVGLEYRPRAATVDGLCWLCNWGYWQ